MPSGSYYIAGRWIDGDGPIMESIDPATLEPVWRGHSATAEEVDAAMAAAQTAQPAWADLPLDRRIAFLQAFAERLSAAKDDFAAVISRETGKPRWESLTEVAAMVAKVPRSVEAFRGRCDPGAHEVDGARGATRFKAQGVVAVFGPFNLPGHLPNGHIVPALLAGNTVVFKPSEKTPGVGALLAELWIASGLPAGVFNLVQGGPETGAALAGHPDLDGLYFTGSCAAGLALRRALADNPGVVLALEMGGNNPLVVHEAADLDAAAYLTIQSAFITAGQRCSCARRLIVPAGAKGDQFLARLAAMMGRIRVGPWTDSPEPFMGPVISPAAAQTLLDVQADFLRRGGRSLMPMKLLGDSRTLLSPGLIDVTAIPDREDREWFGPLLQVIRVPDFAAAIAEANRTRFGLVAGLLSDRRKLWEQFARDIRAGVVNWNRQTTNASGSMPFGGIGLSGNHRPSGFFAADYCSYPVATMEFDHVAMPAKRPPGLDF
jgi:succinylglutamic semialdehyde dehydrogenase